MVRPVIARFRPVAVLLPLICFIGFAAGRFDSKLTGDRQIVHVLNRLTFGPRPGDVELVRRMGVEKWIDQQLHPERIPDDPLLEAKLKPLETLRMEPIDVARKFTISPQQIQMNMLNKPAQMSSLVPQDQLQKLLNGTAEDRRAVLAALDSSKRGQVLSMLGNARLQALPDYAKELEAYRNAQIAERQALNRKLNPPLEEILTTPEQIMTARRGSPEQLMALYNELEPEKRRQMALALGPNQTAGAPELRRVGLEWRNPQQLISGDLKEAKVFRAVYSGKQLEEVLTDFWLNHFNVYENKTVIPLDNAYRALLADYENKAIRPHVLGRFRDLVLAVARHPAMLYYLDNWESTADDSETRMKVGPFAPPMNLNQMMMGSAPPPVSRTPHGLNENFGRELMELHTLGVGGGYTQQDVIELARSLTGWTVHRAEDPVFAYVDFMHDKGEKTILGHKIPAGGGENDGTQAIDILVRHPSTAHFISRQLAQRFVSDDPPAALVERMAAVFLKTDGDLRAVMQSMIASPEFNSEGAWQAKVKSPFELIVSALRATGAEVTDTFTAVQKVADLGEPLYGKVEPNGYPLTGDGWLGTSDLLGRIAFLNSIVNSQVPGVRVDVSAATPQMLLGHSPSPELADAIARTEANRPLLGRELAALVLSSPEFNRR